MSFYIPEDAARKAREDAAAMTPEEKAEWDKALREMCTRRGIDIIEHAPNTRRYTR
jgi:hypothetical protein